MNNNIITDEKKIDAILERGVEEVIDRENLKKELLSGKKLRIKFGIDPTGSDLHLGHSVLFLKLREFQEFGHHILFLIGDFTAQIGDPTGRMTSRVPLSAEKIKENMKNYQEQASKILDMDKVEVCYNSEWYNKMNLGDLMRLTAKVTYSQVSQRADFKKRLAEDQDFTLEEFMYPVLQGYDSVELRADLEIGGNDQKFNMLMGRRVQKQYKQKPQDVITMKLLVGTDGKKKMSKSFGNYIGINESPKNQYGKIMSIKDELILDYFELCTKTPLSEIKQIGKDLKNKKINPKEIKMRLAKEIISLYHNNDAALKVEKEFERIFKEKGLPKKIPEIKVSFPVSLIEVLVASKMVKSKGEANRLLDQKGIKINQKVIEKDIILEDTKKEDIIIQKGKRHFIKLISE